MKLWVAILISENMDLKERDIIEDKWGNFIIRKLISNEIITKLDLCVPNCTSSTYIEQ